MINSKAPSSLRWIWAACISMLALMLFYRTSLLLFFSENWSFWEKISVSVTGIFYDICLLAVIGAIAMLFGLIGGLHPYRNKTGKKFLLIYFMIIAGVLVSFYMFDAAFLAIFNHRPISVQFIEVMQHETKKAIEFWFQFPLSAAFAVLLGLLWTWWKILRYLHTSMIIKESQRDEINFAFWHRFNGYIALVLGIIFIWKIQSAPQNGLINNKAKQNSSLNYNPVQLLLKQPS